MPAAAAIFRSPHHTRESAPRQPSCSTANILQNALDVFRPSRARRVRVRQPQPVMAIPYTAHPHKRAHEPSNPLHPNGHTNSQEYDHPDIDGPGSLYNHDDLDDDLDTDQGHSVEWSQDSGHRLTSFSDPGHYTYTPSCYTSASYHDSSCTDTTPTCPSPADHCAPSDPAASNPAHGKYLDAARRGWLAYTPHLNSLHDIYPDDSEDDYDDDDDDRTLPPLSLKFPHRTFHAPHGRSHSFSTSSLERVDERSEDQDKAKQRSIRLAAAIGHKSLLTQTQPSRYAMSDPGHGSFSSAPASPSSRLRSLATRHSSRYGRATWAGYPPLDMILESGYSESRQKVAFPGASSSQDIPFQLHHDHSRLRYATTDFDDASSSSSHIYTRPRSLPQAHFGYPSSSRLSQYSNTVSFVSSSTAQYSYGSDMSGSNSPSSAHMSVVRSRKPSNKLRKAPPPDSQHMRSRSLSQLSLHPSQHGAHHLRPRTSAVPPFAALSVAEPQAYTRTEEYQSPPPPLSSTTHESHDDADPSHPVVQRGRKKSILKRALSASVSVGHRRSKSAAPLSSSSSCLRADNMMDGYEIEPLQLPMRSRPPWPHRERRGATVKVWDAEKEEWNEGCPSGDSAGANAMERHEDDALRSRHALTRNDRAHAQVRSWPWTPSSGRAEAVIQMERQAGDSCPAGLGSLSPADVPSEVRLDHTHEGGQQVLNFALIHDRERAQSDLGADCRPLKHLAVVDKNADTSRRTGSRTRGDPEDVNTTTIDMLETESMAHSPRAAPQGQICQDRLLQALPPLPSTSPTSSRHQEPFSPPQQQHNLPPHPSQPQSYLHVPQRQNEQRQSSLLLPPQALQHRQLSQPQARPRVLVKRVRSISASASSSPVSSRPNIAMHTRGGSACGSSASHASHYSSSTSSGWPSSSSNSSGWPSSTSAGTSPPTSEAMHASSSSSSSASSSASASLPPSACPPVRPQSYFADLDLPRCVSDVSVYDTRHPVVVGVGSGGGGANVGGVGGKKLTKRRPSGYYGHQQAVSMSAVEEVTGTRGGRSRSRSRSRTKGVLDEKENVLVHENEKVGEDADGTRLGAALRRQDKSKKSRSRSRQRGEKRKSVSVDARVRNSKEEQDHVLPPLRPPSPLWAGSLGKFPSAYSGHSFGTSPHTVSSEASIRSQPAPSSSTTTDALTSLAFTGNTGLLSSSALAALTSRLTHRASSGQLYEQSQSQSPPFVFSVKEYEHAAFDPYAEQKAKARKKGKEREDKMKESEREKDKDKMSKKARIMMPRPSLASLRVEMTGSTGSSGAALARKPSPVPPVPPLPPKYQGQKVNPDAAKRAIPRPRAKTNEQSPDALRRWTLAMADVPDEVLVQELERIRLEGRGSRKKRKSGMSSSGGRASSNGHSNASCEKEREERERALVYGGPEEAKWRESEWVKLREEESESECSGSEDELEGALSPRSVLSEAEEDAGWKSARRALLCCRELVRTERSYQSRLRQLLAGETETPPPPLVLSYVSGLLRASEALLARLEDDPSAWGVSVAFVGVEEEVEAAFVAWCGVVGEIFMEGGDTASSTSEHKAVKSAKNSPTLNPPVSAGAFGRRSVSGVSIAQVQPQSIYRKRERNVSYLGNEPVGSKTPSSGPEIGMFTAALGTGLAYNISPSVAPQHASDGEFGGVHTPSAGAGSGSLSISKALKRMSVFSSASSLHSTPPTPRSAPATIGAGKKMKSKERKERKPSVRELAIQPTQRVMRYVLQYRDLLAHTPTESPSRGLVERALESAVRIAAKCDRAQGNSAFLRRQ